MHSPEDGAAPLTRPAEGVEDVAGEGIFAVPAFQASLQSVTRLVRSYTEGLPELQERLGERLLGGCYGRQDAEKLAHYALIATEVAKPDMLQDLQYELEFGAPRLLGVPFYKKADATVDAFFQIEVWSSCTLGS